MTDQNEADLAEEYGVSDLPMLLPDEDDDTTPLCGESYDHQLKLISEADGIATYECEECGAEVIDEES